MFIKIHEVSKDNSLESILENMSNSTREWELRAARGECGWICSSCCVSDVNGMPDVCFHGQEWCTKIIARNKQLASQ